MISEHLRRQTYILTRRGEAILANTDGCRSNRTATRRMNYSRLAHSAGYSGSKRTPQGFFAGVGKRTAAGESSKGLESRMRLP